MTLRKRGTVIKTPDTVRTLAEAGCQQQSFTAGSGAPAARIGKVTPCAAVLMAWLFVTGVSVSCNSAATPTPHVGQTSHPEAANGQWAIRSSTDEMTGESKLQAVMVANADSNGRHGTFEVTATCTARILAFKIIYLSAFDKNLGFQQTQGTSMVTLYNGVGTMDTPKPQVNLRARIDDGNVTNLVSTSDFRNQAGILFTQRTLGNGLSQLLQGGGRSTGSGQDANDVMADLRELGMALGAAGTTADAYHAKIIRVELPLDNGDAPILTIRPQDPSFRAYASRCATVDASAFVNAIKGEDGYVFGSETVMPSRLFKGTAEAFAAAFPGFLQRAAPTRGFDAETSQKDAAFVARVVRTCAQITPQVALSVTDKTGWTALANLGDQFKDCGIAFINVSERLGTYHKDTQRAVILTIDPIGPRGWRDGQGFWVTVYFSPLKTDRVMLTPGNMFDVLSIARAMILPAH